MIHFSDFHFLLEVLKNLRIYSFISFFLKKHLKASRRKVWVGAQIPWLCSEYILPSS